MDKPGLTPRDRERLRESLNNCLEVFRKDPEALDSSERYLRTQLENILESIDAQGEPPGDPSN